MTSRQEKAWQTIAVQTKAMRHAVQNGEWQRLIQIEQERKRQIDSALQDLKQNQHATLIGQTISTLLEQDKKIIDAVEQHMAQLMQETLQVKRTQQALQHYASSGLGQ